MPLNKRGGCKNRRNPNSTNKKIEYPDGNEQEIGICIKTLGSGRFTIRYFDTQKQTLVETIGIARRTLRKRQQWVKPDYYVIISKRDYENKFVDIIYVYDPEFVSDLKRQNLINDCLMNDTEKDDNFDFQEDIPKSDTEEETNIQEN